MHTLRRRFLSFCHTHRSSAPVLLLAPATLWLVLFTLLPMAIVVYYSFLTRGAWGSVTSTLTLENYQQLLDPTFGRVLLRSLWMAVCTTALSLGGGYVLAYWIAFASGPYKSLCLFLVILPFWSSDLVRVYAWITLLADHGLINNALLAVGFITAPLPLLHNAFAVLLGLVYTYLPFMVLPLYAALERLDGAVLEAAADLGATPARRFFKVTLPLTRGGMLSGSVLVFVPTLGEFVIPELLGGAKVMLIGKLIALKFTGLRHWPLGAAYSLVLLLIILGLLLVYLRLGGSQEVFEERKT